MTERTTDPEAEFLRPGEAARRLRVHPRTLTRMAERGDLHSVTLPSGHRRYLEVDVETLANPQRVIA